MSKTISSLQQFAMLGIAFFLPFHMTFVYPFFLIVIMCEIFNRDFFLRQVTMFSSPLVLVFIFFFFVNLVGLTWSSDMVHGTENVKRYVPFLLFGFLWLAAKYENQDKYIICFISGVTFCSILAHYNLLQQSYPNFLAEGIVSGKRNGEETSPFLSHLNYAPIIALAIYFVSFGLFRTTSNIKEFAIRTSILLLLLSNLLFSTGRAGFLMLIVLFSALIFQTSRNIRTSIIKLLIIVPLSTLAAYNISDTVKNRVDGGLNDIQTFTENPNTSVGLRMVFAIHSFDIFLKNPVFGVGTGDLKNEYEKIKRTVYEKTITPNNPHNQYLMIASTLGLLGLLAMFLIFFTAFKFCDSRGKAMILGFIAICFVESYLWRANTSLTFIFFISVLSQRRSFLFSSTIK